MVGRFYILNRKDFISVHEKRINNLRYADDTVIMTNIIPELVEIMSRLNKWKTKIMIFNRQNNNSL